MEEWEGVFDVDRVGWDDCALVVGDGVESVVYGVGGVVGVGWDGGMVGGSMMRRRVGSAWSRGATRVSHVGTMSVIIMSVSKQRWSG